MLEFSSSTPLYIQIKDAILNDILSGKLRPGEKIPTEIALSTMYGVSRITIRSAIMDLVDKGYLVRQQGKGTYVYKPVLGENVRANQSFTSVCKASGAVPGSKIITMSVQIASDDDVSELQIPIGSKILYLERVRYANGTPVVLEYNYLPEKFITLISEPLENVSLYGLLENKFNIGKLDSVKTISIANADAYQSKLLNIKKGTPVLYLNEIVYDASQEPVHRTRQYINGDRFKYIVRYL